jgi:carbon monoxide dehydrogenase subunit G
MKLTNEFTVGADPDTVWRTLLDMEGVAGCLPGATITATDREDTYEGTMRVKIGPMAVSYQGTATLTEVDEDARRAVISLKAREARGQGTAMATITNAVQPSDGGARVTAETDLHITGAQARFGRGVMEDVAGRVLREFSSRLERQLAEGSPQAGAGAPQDEPRPSPGAQEEASGEEALDMGAMLSQSAAGRYAKIAAPAALVLLVLLVLLRRR